jgi:glycosyltransferase involved in cell wall biosynthesis
MVIEKMEASKAEISIAAIIPLYNGAAYIRESLGSVLAQTEPPDEIIVVNDGSTDDGPQIVEEMAKSHPIRLISRPNGGIGAARNHGIAECKSTHIALLDQDDVWYEDHLEVLKRPFARANIRNLGLVYANLDRIDKYGRMVEHNFLNSVSPVPKTSLLNCLSRDMFVLPGASLFEKAAFESVGRFDERLSGYEDDDLFLRMFSGGFRSVYLRNNAVTKWRIYPASTSYSPRMAKSRMIYFHKLVDTYLDEPELNLHWIRDAIAPRFFENVRFEFTEGLSKRDRARMLQAWQDIWQVLPFMRKKVQWRMRLVSPLISAFCRTPFRRVTRRLLKMGVRG